MRHPSAAATCVLLALFGACDGSKKPRATDGANASETGASSEADTERPARFNPKKTISAEELADLERFVAENPDDAVAQQQLGRGLRDARRNAEALEHFQRAAELDPGSPRLLLDLALAHTAVSNLDQAAEVYDSLMIVPSMTALASHNKGNILLRQGDATGAITLYRQALEAKPDYLLAWYHLGVALEQTGEYREAYRAFGRVVEFPPPDEDPAVLGGYVDAWYRMGKLDIAMGATERGTEILAELIASYPDHPNAHYQYGQALLKLGRQEEAERELAIHMEILSRAKPTGTVATGE